ncbi:MAG: hypothetical protein RIB43_03265 [Rhodospirillaceae bacterium]
MSAVIKSLPQVNLVEDLRRLQSEQFDHDETYHREIARLSFHHRMNHMALHFSKYVGQIEKARLNNDYALLNKTIIDAAIISLSSANILNIPLWKILEHKDIWNWADCLKAADKLSDIVLPISEDLGWYSSSMMILSGNLAKACESLDHVEDFPFRKEMSKSVEAIFFASVIAADQQNLDVPREIRSRLMSVKEKWIYHGE